MDGAPTSCPFPLFLPASWLSLNKCLLSVYFCARRGHSLPPSILASVCLSIHPICPSMPPPSTDWISFARQASGPTQMNGPWPPPVPRGVHSFWKSVTCMVGQEVGRNRVWRPGKRPQEELPGGHRVEASSSQCLGMGPGRQGDGERGHLASLVEGQSLGPGVDLGSPLLRSGGRQSSDRVAGRLAGT